MPHCIDPAMDGAKGASLNPTPDRPPSNSGCKQLVSTNDPVLRFCQLGKHAIDVAPVSPRTRFTFCPSEGLNVNLIRRSRELASLDGHDPRSSPEPPHAWHAKCQVSPQRSWRGRARYAASERRTKQRKDAGRPNGSAIRPTETPRCAASAAARRVPRPTGPGSTKRGSSPPMPPLALIP
jgi:hypothetical protein